MGREPMMSWTEGFLTDCEDDLTIDNALTDPAYKPGEVVRAVRWLYDRCQQLETDRDLWLRMYTHKLKWGHDLCMTVLRTAAEGGTPVAALEVVADFMDGVDMVDDESIELFVKGRDQFRALGDVGGDGTA